MKREERRGELERAGGPAVSCVAIVVIRRETLAWPCIRFILDGSSDMTRIGSRFGIGGGGDTTEVWEASGTACILWCLYAEDAPACPFAGAAAVPVRDSRARARSCSWVEVEADRSCPSRRKWASGELGRGCWGGAMFSTGRL